MKEAFIWCYPWDLEDEGLDAALGRIAGELGLDAVSIAASHGTLAEIRPRLDASSRSFLTAAGAAFQPDGRHYGGTRIRPPAAAWLKSRNPLAKIAEAAERHRLGLRINIVCHDSPTLVQRHPHAACVNWLGDASDRWLCPSCPEVREYLGAMVEDLAANYPARTIELEAFAFSPRRLVQYDASWLPDDDLSRSIMAWCFCAACRQRARDGGIDVDGLVARMHERLGAQIEQSSGQTLADFVAQEPLVAAYEQLRVQTVSSLVAAIRARTTTRLMLHLSPQAGREAVRIPEFDAHCDGWISVAGGERQRTNEIASSSRVSPSRREAAFLCHPPMCKDGPSLVSAVHEASQAGYAGVGFSHYGVAPEQCLDWIRQAIRYARRESAKSL